MLSRQSLRRFVWLALIAMLGLALAPAVSRALSVLHTGHRALAASAALQATSHEECDDAAASNSETAQTFAAATPAAVAQHAGHGAHDNGAAGDHDHLNHCPLCGIAATAWSVAPAAPCWAVQPHAATRVALPAYDAAQRSVETWPAHRPRGPPNFI